MDAALAYRLRGTFISFDPEGDKTMIVATPWLSTLFFIAMRLGTVILLSPMQAVRQLPIALRLLLVLMFSMLIINYLNILPTAPNNSLSLLIVHSPNLLMALF